MSWDILLLRVPGDIAAIEQLPDGFCPEDLGSREHVCSVLGSTLPDFGVAEPGWASAAGPGWFLETYLGEDDPVVSLILQTRGNGDDVLPPVLAVARQLACGAIDLWTGKVLRDVDTTGWAEFQAYRSQLMTRDPAEPGPQSER
nr:hypothetical protein [Kibdelosporangium sp. MJ126-NF4]CEL21440.1 hypothetical protein [Kibdelosporangium sp. MJ126-NF4]CTQ95993.1 hypothetical protein [Kibdelosporangium sp. MJ126-NF4]